MPHFPFTDVVNSLAASNWGREFEEPTNAAEAMAKDPARLTAFALVELLKRLSAVADAIGAAPKRTPVVHERLTSNEGTKRFPKKNVGDRLFSFENGVESGVWEYVIIAKDDEGVCLVAEAYNFDLDHPPCVCVAQEWMRATVQEALRDAANEAVEHHEPRLTYAQGALAALENGETLEAYLEGSEELTAW